MMKLLAGFLLPLLVAGQSTSTCGPAPSGSVRPSIASGYTYQVVATGLAKPRGLAFDGAGNLLVVEAGAGRISAHTFNDTASNGCLSVASSINITDDDDLNHGIAISADGRTLYASNADQAYAYEYDATGASTSNRRTLVTNMTGTDHSTRTLLLSQRVPGMLVISFGSQSNLDIQATSVTTGSSSVKAFNLTNLTESYTYQSHGLLLGWGLRNEVGIAEHPVTGGIWGVENSADQLNRSGVDIHATNPGEELNWLGYLNGTSTTTQGTNFGYPFCFAAWNTSALPNNSSLRTGDQFAIDAASTLDNRNLTDAECANTTRPRLVFTSHMAPLDMKFNDTGREAWVSFHGSWNSPQPVGYKVSVIAFGDDGQPVDDQYSTTAARDILGNADNSACPGSCLRPAGLVVDARGRVFVSSDSTGEIYMIKRDATSNGTAPSSSGNAGNGTGSSGGSGGQSAASLSAPVSMVAVMAGATLALMAWSVM